MNLRKVRGIGKNRKLLVIAVVILLSTCTAYSIYAGNVNEAKPAKKSEAQPKITDSKSGKSGKQPGQKQTQRKFAIEIVNVKESGTLSRIVTARLINKDGYAKNVKLSLELFVDKDRVKVNGENALVIAVGDMDANSSVEREVEISVGFFDGLKIKSKGYVDAKLTITWDKNNGKGREVYRKRIKI